MKKKFEILSQEIMDFVFKLRALRIKNTVHVKIKKK
jgi:hypothetical protein